MKTIFQYFLVLLFLVAVTFSSCQKNDTADSPKNQLLASTQLKTDPEFCGTPIVAPLVDYTQTVTAGSVTIGNDTSTLYVNYQLNGNWRIYQALLYVGLPENAPGTLNADGTGVFNPAAFPVQSPYYGTFTQTHSFQVSLGTLDDCFIVVALVKAKDTVTNELKEVWGKPLLKSHGYYFDYCVQTCAPPPPPTPLGGCETAYAWGDSYATCFLNIAGVNSNNWGWSNGPVGAGSYSWPMYAGAGQCNISNGTYVGTLAVSYAPPTATITYTVLNGYALNETHLFVGNQILPLKKGKYTTAPGQFPYKHENLNGATSDTYTISGLSGNIYIAAHSVVCDAD